MTSSLKDIIQCVMKVNTASGSGSAFYLADYDLFVTNFHVIEGHKDVALETHDRDRYSAKVVLANPGLDLAFLKICKKLSLPSLKLGDLTQIPDREKVNIVGHPYGMPVSVTEGVISAKSQILGGREFIQTDASVNPGNSGGPMVSASGHVLGVTTCKFSEADNMGFALPVSFLAKELEAYSQLSSGGHVVACPDCNFYLTERAEHCDNCGTTLNVEVLFAEFKPSPLSKFVEEVLGNVGVDPVTARIGRDYWNYHQGSAQIRIFNYNGRHIIATSPLVKLPKQNMEKVMEFILANQQLPFRLGISDNQIHLSYRFHVSDLENSNVDVVKANMGKLVLEADKMDNFLVETFGCEWSENSKVLKVG